MFGSCSGQNSRDGLSSRIFLTINVYLDIQPRMTAKEFAEKHAGEWARGRTAYDEIEAEGMIIGYGWDGAGVERVLLESDMIVATPTSRTWAADECPMFWVRPLPLTILPGFDKPKGQHCWWMDPAFTTILNREELEMTAKEFAEKYAGRKVIGKLDGDTSDATGVVIGYDENYVLIDVGTQIELNGEESFAISEDDLDEITLAPGQKIPVGETCWWIDADLATLVVSETPSGRPSNPSCSKAQTYAPPSIPCVICEDQAKKATSRGIVGQYNGSKAQEQSIHSYMSAANLRFQADKKARIQEAAAGFATEADLERIGAVSGGSATMCILRTRTKPSR